MPNIQVWGQQDAIPLPMANQDLVSLGNEIIEVADIADATRVALKASNIDGANSVAIEAGGQVKVTAVSDDDPASQGIHVINSSTNADARALKVEGKAEIADLDADDVALLATNTNLGDSARALKAEGTSEFAGSVIVRRDDGIGTVDVGAINIGTEEDPDLKPRLSLWGLNAGPGAPSARVEAMMDIPGNYRNEATLYLNHDEGNYDVIISHDDSGEALNNSATVWVKSPRMRLGTTMVDVNMVKQIGHLDGGGTAEEALDLRIGTLNITNNVEIGHDQHLVIAKGRLDAEKHIRVGTNGIDGKIDANGTAKLKLGSDVLTNHVEIGRSQQWTAVKGPLFAEEHIQVGTGADGKVDASANNRELKIGTDTTNNVTIGRIAQGLWTKVVNLFKAEGHIQVGTTAAGGDGKVDAASNNRDLKIGTDTTGNVRLSRAGQTIDMFGQARMNSNAIILNNVATILTAGSIALIANAAGHGNGPSIDIYIGGAMVRYVDATGWF